jgi:hypothetical protein
MEERKLFTQPATPVGSRLARVGAIRFMPRRQGPRELGTALLNRVLSTCRGERLLNITMNDSLIPSRSVPKGAQKTQGQLLHNLLHDPGHGRAGARDH